MGSQGMRAQAKLPASLQNPTLSRRDLSALLPATDPRPALTVSRGPMGHWSWVPRSRCSSVVIPEDSGVGGWCCLKETQGWGAGVGLWRSVPFMRAQTRFSHPL